MSFDLTLTDREPSDKLSSEQVKFSEALLKLPSEAEQSTQPPESREYWTPEMLVVELEAIIEPVMLTEVFVVCEGIES